MNTKNIKFKTPQHEKKKELKPNKSDGFESPKANTTIIKKNKSSDDSGQNKLKLISDDRGIKKFLSRDEELADKIKFITMSATKGVSVKDEGLMIIPDYNAQLAAAKMQCELKGHFKEKKGDNPLEDGIYQLID